MRKAIFVFFGCLLCATSLAFASGNERFAKHFGDMDANSDGFLDKAEWTKAMPGDEAEFTKADTSKDGKIDHDEWHAFKKSKGVADKHS